MAKTLPRLSRKYLDQPQFITPSKFEEIAEVLDSRDRSYFKSAYLTAVENDFELTKTSCAIFEDYYTRRESGKQPQYGVLNVEGVTTYKATGWEALCGGTSYESLVTQMEDFVDQGIKEVYMLVDSGGGEAYMMMQTSQTLRKLADDNGIKLVGYVDGMAASAGYGLLTSCHEIITNTDAEIGSIGVVISLMNNSEQLAKEGIKRSFITAGASKVPFDEAGDFKEEFLADLQGKVDVLYEQFTGHVAGFREGMSQDQVKSTEAKMFQSDKALALGLVDKVMELRDFKKEYLSGYNLSSVSNQNQKETLMSDQLATPELSAEDIAVMQTQLAQMKDMEAQLATFQSEKLEAEKATLSSNLDSKPFLADCKEDLVSFLMNAEIGEDVKSLMNTVIAGADASMSELTATHVQALATVTEDADAKVLLAETAKNDAVANAEQIKTEFATGKFSVDAEVDDVLVTLSHEEKLANAVAAEKARKAKTQ